MYLDGCLGMSVDECVGMCVLLQWGEGVALGVVLGDQAVVDVCEVVGAASSIPSAAAVEDIGVVAHAQGSALAAVASTSITPLLDPPPLAHQSCTALLPAVLLQLLNCLQLVARAASEECLGHMQVGGAEEMRMEKGLAWQV